MHNASYYLALAIATLPASALMAVMICLAWPRTRRWMDRHLTRRLGNHYRDESWHSLGRIAPTQTRTRR